MGESPSLPLPQLTGLTIEAVEWLPSGADSGLVRVRGRWSATEAARPGLPELVLRVGDVDHRFESLPDARFARDPASWRGSYLVPVALVAAAPEVLWVEWPGGVRSGLPALAPGLAHPPPAAEPAEEEPEGGQLIDRGVLAERRARRAEAAEQAQARVAAEALRAVEALELQSAELERRLAEATAERDALAAGVAPPAPAAPLVPPAEVAQLERMAERRQAALAAALESLAQLRRQTREWRLKLRTAEMARAGDAVRLAVLEAERVTAGDAADAAEREGERRLELARAELEDVRAALTRGKADLEEAREQAEGRLAAALAAAEETRATLQGQLAEAQDDAAERLAAAQSAAEEMRDSLERRRLGEQAVFEEVRAALQQRLGAAEGRAAALEAAQAELVTERDSAGVRAASLHDRVADLEATLAATETRLHSATAAIATTEAQLRVESVARVALEAELDRDRDARAALAAERDALATDLAAERQARAADREAFSAELTAERATRAAERDAAIVLRDEHGPDLGRELADERARREEAEADRSAFETDLAAARAARNAAQQEVLRVRAELEAERDARRAAAEPPAAEEPAPAAEPPAAPASSLGDAAREQSEAAAAAARAPDADSARVVADLDAAAAALRSSAPPAEGNPAETTAAETTPVEEEVPAAAPPPERTGPTIISATSHPPRLDATGRSTRHYPALRGAIVKLAHDDPVAAGRLLAALLPAHAAALADPLDYDLTIREVGTFAITASGGATQVRPLDAPRPRGEADLHLTADALTLAELLAGVPRHVGRVFGPARFRGSRRSLSILRALPATRLTIAEAARAGAQIAPGLVYRALSYAVHPSWTRGQRFTVAQEITGETPETWYLTARNGAGLSVSDRPPPEGADATVSMTPAAFATLLRGEAVPSGERPSVRGDRGAVSRMKAWADRAQR